MPKAIRIHQTGGPEVLRWEDVEVSEPKEGEVLIRHTAVGLNFVDVYFRTGLYPTPPLPFVPGSEAAGVVQAVGPGVTDLKVGDHVAYGQAMGAYSQERVIPAAKVVRLPHGIEDKAAAAMMLKGMTAHYLLHRCYQVNAVDTILVHAAAGGVGTILCQWARHLGATVIGTVSSEAKAKLAADHGCQHPIVYTKENFVERAREITKGEGVPVVYDSVGKDTFLKSLDCLRPFGTLVLFGQSSGPVEPFNLGLLAQKGSLYVTRPTLATYAGKRTDMVTMAEDLFDVVREGYVKIEINQTFPLQDAADAHRALEGRKTTGSTVLVP